MEQRRFFLFLVLSLGILIGWTTFVAPRFFPPPKPAQNAGADAKVGEDAVAPADGPAVAENVEGEDAVAQPGPAPAAALPDHPRETVVLGSLDPESGFFLQATLTSEGAAVESIQLNDPRYRDLLDKTQPLRIVGDEAVDGRLVQSLQTGVPAFDEQIRKLNGEKPLARIPWEIVPGSQSPSGVTFRIQAPDGSFEIRKRYTLPKIDLKGRDFETVRNTTPEGYQLGLEITLHNLAEKPQTLSYLLQGPVGVPLENVENARKFRDVRVGFLEEDGDVRSEMIAVGDIVEAAQEDTLEQWKAPVKYIGVDMQYFAALLVPGGDQLKSPYIAVASPELLVAARDEARSSVSVQMTSVPLELAPGGAVTHEYSLYAGPKRETLLTSIDAEDVIDFGFAGPISKGMLWLMKAMHDVGIPYGIAIICLTIIVRGCLFPLSRKQAIGAKKMKELQPKIAELKKKYGNDREKMARAQMELFSKHNYNPFAGCLPIFLQLPIFIGLYNALNNSVDLRMASFLWIDNLAAPDALFRLPFRIPYLGEYFNLLPLLTVGLFIVQQKMFMPPPAPDDEQAQMQYKMMNFMMIFMGFMFYHVPAGLCVYFIASSLWGIGERKMLDWFPPKVPEPKPDSERKTADDGAPKGLWGKLLAHAEAAAKEAQLQQSKATADPNGDGSRGRKKSKPRR